MSEWQPDNKIIEELIKKAINANGESQFNETFKLIEHYISLYPEHIALLETRAELHIKRQNFGAAINDFLTIQTLDPLNTKAAIQIEQLRTILKFQNTDIFENPNTSFDPWLD